jgi:hypothetical protein
MPTARSFPIGSKVTASLGGHSADSVHGEAVGTLPTLASQPPTGEPQRKAQPAWTGGAGHHAFLLNDDGCLRVHRQGDIQRVEKGRLDLAHQAEPGSKLPV